MELGFDLLDGESNINEFDCGVVELNSYLKDLALLFQRRRFGVTVVFHEKKNVKKKVIGFYTLCPTCIQREILPEKLLTGPKPNPIPGFRLCRLAVDKHFQGRGIGQIIFVHALKKCLDQAIQIGGSIILIDAKDESAKTFYERFGFKSIQGNSLLLVQTIKYVQHHFEAVKK